MDDDEDDDGEHLLDGLDDDGATDEHPDDDADEHPRRPQAGAGWEVRFAQMDDDGQWRFVGAPVPDASFVTMALAHEYAERRNRRQFGR